jgi:coenzyme F420-reducing hydrogenase delta subunit
MRRVPLTKVLLKEMGIEPNRLRLEWVSASEGVRFQEVITEFTEQVRNIGPLKLQEWKFEPEAILESEQGA